MNGVAILMAENLFFRNSGRVNNRGSKCSLRSKATRLFFQSIIVRFRAHGATTGRISATASPRFTQATDALWELFFMMQNEAQTGAQLLKNGEEIALLPVLIREISGFYDFTQCPGSARFCLQRIGRRDRRLHP